jgi:hypothetical protein
LAPLDVEIGQWTQPSRAIEEGAVIPEQRDLLEDLGDRLAMMALLDLDEQQGSASTERLSTSSQNVELGAFDVDLHERQIEELEGVEGLERDFENRIGVSGCAKAR